MHDAGLRTHAEGTQADSAASIGSEMRVGISSFASWMLGVGAMIGSYAWLVHGPMIARAGPMAAVSAWIVAAIATLPAAFILAELSSMFPSAGGPYVFKYYAFKRLLPKAGELIGFCTGWLFYVCVIAGLGAMANGFSNLLCTNLYGGPHAGPLWFGPVVITLLYVGCTVLNMLSVDRAAMVNNIATIGKFIMAFSFAALVLCAPHSSLQNVLTIANPEGSTNFFANFTSVFMIAVSGYAGIEITSCAGSETKDASKTVPRAIIFTLLATAFFYVGMCIAVSAASPYVLDKAGAFAVIQGTAVQATCPSLTGYLAGPFWGNVMTAAVVASIVGCGFTCILSCARVGYSMAKTGLFPRRFGELHAGTQTPRYALWFQLWCLLGVSIVANVLSTTGICSDAYVFMGEVFGFIYSFLALLYGFCLLSLRYTDPDLPRPFRLGRRGNGAAWTMAIVAAVIYGYAAFACTSVLVQVTGFVLMLSGVPIYFWYRRESRQSGK